MGFAEQVRKHLQTFMVVYLLVYTAIEAWKWNPWAVVGCLGTTVVLYVLICRVGEKMSQNEEEKFEPDWLSPPGDTIKDLLDEQRLALEEFAVSMQLSRDEAQQLIAGEIAINDGLAKKLEQQFKAPAQFWLRRQALYEKDCRRLEAAGGAEPSQKIVSPQAVQVLIYENRHGGHEVVVEAHGERLTGDVAYPTRTRLNASNTMRLVGALVDKVTDVPRVDHDE